MNCFEANLRHHANWSIYTSWRRYQFLQITISQSRHNINSNVNGLLILYHPRPTPLLQTSWLLLLTLYSSYNEYLHNRPRAPPILAVLRPHFGLEPPYRGPCKGVNVRYFFNASSTFWEPFVYGGCDAKENNLLRAADCRRTCGGSLGHWGKTGGRQGEGRAGVRAWGHTQNLTVTFSLAAAQEKWLQCLVKPYTEHVFQGPAWQRVTATNPIMIIWAYSHAPLSQIGTLSQHLMEQVRSARLF